MSLFALFVKPVDFSSTTALWLILPLSAAVAIVYKTIRTEDIRRLPLQCLAAILYVYAGLGALGAGLWLFQRYWH